MTTLILPPGLARDREQPLALVDEGAAILREVMPRYDGPTMDLKPVAAAMFQVMTQLPGRDAIGLAAPQVGLRLRMFIMNTKQAPRQLRDTRVCINPEVVQYTAETETEREGCLTIPAFFADVTRPRGVRVRYYDLRGRWCEDELWGVPARCFQHELDHLGGITLTDLERRGDAKRVRAS